MDLKLFTIWAPSLSCDPNQSDKRDCMFKPSQYTILLKLKYSFFSCKVKQVQNYDSHITPVK